MKKILPLLFTLTAIAFFDDAHATHVRAGEVIAEKISCSSYRYRISVVLYVDTEGIEPGQGTLDYGDGTFEELQLRGVEPDYREYLGDNVEKVIYIRDHVFPGPGTYIIGFREENRNSNIKNIDTSVEVAFYVETQILIDPTFGCDNSPVLLNPPVDKGCVGVAFFHNAGASDIDGDSLSYEFTTPKQRRSAEVPGYEFPHLADAGAQNENQTGSATFTLNKQTGDIVWNAPGGEGEYNFAFRVISWKKIDGKWFKVGYVTRDMQVIVEDCDNQRPELILPSDTCVVAGALLDAEIRAEDPDGDPVKITSFGTVYQFLDNPAQLTPDPATYQIPPAIANFSWQTTCERIGNLPYFIFFKANDTLNGPKLADYDTWLVNVVGPPPQNLIAAQGNLNNVELSWDPYECSNAQTIKIYRKVDTYEFTPGNCELGIPENSGYELIAEVPANTTSYVDRDKDLQYGVNYCYRTVATYNVPEYMESVASEETCVLLEEGIDALVTNVSVTNTSESEGRIFVRWTPPFGVDPAINPPPYSYELYRGVGFDTPGDVSVTNGRIADTTFTDTGLNTLNEVYNYFLIVYDGNAETIDTTSLASSVRANPSPIKGAIELSWEANTPWSNFAQNYPMHLIYRDNIIPGEPEQLVLYDSVNVFLDGFTYLDDGTTSGEGILDDKKEYCYYITTRGTYGNDTISEPLLNNSQIICAQPNDTIVPCGPSQLVVLNDCEELRNQVCDFDDYENILAWSFDLTQECGFDVRGFKVYFSPTGNEEDFQEIAHVTDTFFVHTDIPSYKGCYRVTAVDRSGNESEPTETLCKDNCPFYFLPNIFTPNGDGPNDTFQAFYDTPQDRDNPYSLCPRFVQSVKFEVYNRWGELVYDFQSGGENTIFIRWDGISNEGKPLPAGTYYYLATVTFDMLDPKQKVQEIKGWVKIDRGN